jgi:hypothetical protein
MTAAGYFVEGVQLVNVGGELCEACGDRKAVGRSISGHVLCQRCAGLHSVFAEELAAEKAASEKRVAEKRGQSFLLPALITTVRRRTVESRPTYPCGHPRTPANTYTRPDDGRKFCRKCRNDHSKKSKERARQREQKRLGRFSA